MEILWIFIAWFLAAQVLLTAAQLLLRKKRIKAFQRVILIVVKALLGIAFGVLPLAGPVQLRSAQPLMMALYVALLADAAADTVYSIITALRKKERRFGTAKAVSLICGVLFLACGMVNMETVTPEYHTYSSDKLTGEHTVVFFADLHVGSAQPFSVTEKTVNEMLALKPEAIIMGGDIVDDYTTAEEMRATFRLFAGSETPVYYIYGNHDRQGHAEYAGGRKFSEEELEQAMTECGVIILKDAFAQLSPDLALLGREDISEGEGRADASTLVNPWPDAYLIVADHQPGEAKQNLVTGMDLQLSGHTHAGQLFPLRLFYNLIGYCYGDYALDGATLNVSAGACGWRMPLRTDARCHYEVITLKPAE